MKKKYLFLQVVLIVLTLRISLRGITSIIYVVPKAAGTVWGNGKAWALALDRLVFRTPLLYLLEL